MSLTFKIVIAVVLSSLATFLILRFVGKSIVSGVEASTAKTALDADSLEGFTI